MTTNNDNLPVAFEFGRRAGRQIIDAARNGEGAEANMVMALYECIMEDVEFIAVVHGKDGEEGERYRFNVLDMRHDPIGADGKVDTKQKKARNVAIAQTLFNLGDADNAFSTMLRRALSIALYIDSCISSLDDDGNAELAASRVKIVQRKRERRGVPMTIDFLTVPAFMLFDPKDKALKLNEQQVEQWSEELRFLTCELDGSKLADIANVNKSLNQLRKMADTAAGKRGTRANQAATPEQTFANAIKFVDTALAIANDPARAGEKGSVALSKEMRLKLFLIQQRIAAYFQQEELSDEEKEALSKAA